MTPEQKIKWAVVARVFESKDREPPEYPCANIEELYDALDDDPECECQDIEADLRCGQVETDLYCPFSRHYESKSVGMKMPDGSWVGWTYWYGGGKHGQPESIEWMSEAYDLECHEEEKMVVVQTFKRASDG